MSTSSDEQKQRYPRWHIRWGVLGFLGSILCFALVFFCMSNPFVSDLPDGLAFIPVIGIVVIWGGAFLWAVRSDLRSLWKGMFVGMFFFLAVELLYIGYSLLNIFLKYRLY
ncbi:MAG: hypothetical protein ACYC7E_03895 [Armatimonadota bacterium]